jgi:opacity protein-like surface antigen
MRIRSIALASTIIAVAGSASAADLYRPAPAPVIVAPAPAPVGGLYVSLHGGFNWITDTDADFVGGPGTFSTDSGYRLGGAIGYDFNSVFGIELEGSYAHADVTSVDGVDLVDSTGAITTVMANLIVGQSFGVWRPYVGVGAGWANVDLSVNSGDGVHQSDGTWAAQALVGLDFNLTRNVSLGGRYRFQYIGETNYIDGSGVDPVSIDNITSHSAELVLKVRFN